MFLQGSCGSCWAFSVTGAIESGNYLLGTRTLTPLSEQQLVDCATRTTSAGNWGCDGGDMAPTFGWLVSTGGLCSEASYPYTAVDGTCRACTKVTTIAGYQRVTAFSDSALQTAVSRQPVAVSVEASDAFQVGHDAVLR